MTISPRAFRRTFMTGGVVSAVLAAMLAGGAGTSGAATAGPALSGTATAIATSYKLNPTAAGLSIGIGFGVSLSDYTNQVARAESRGIDLGIIGTTLAAEGCDGGAPTLPADQQPQPLRADSRDPKAAQGYSEQESWAPMITKSVKADGSPDSEATTTSFPLGDGNTLTINGAQSRTVTRVIDGKTREAQATVDVGSIDVAGVVHMAGLHWEALHHSGADQTVKGTFTIGSVTIAGNAVPTADPSAAIAAANTALSNLGVELRAPRAHTDAGILFIDPLAIAVVPSPTRDGVTNGVLGAAQPVRQSLYDGLLAASCKAGSPITVTDIVVGSITGAGEFAVELGGAQATTSDLTATHYFQDFKFTATPALPAPTFSAPSTGSLDQAPVATPAPAASVDTPVAAAPAALPAPKAPAPRRVLPAAAHLPTKRGALAGVAGVGLLLVLAMAEGDRRMMRRAQRSIPVEG